ncbi:MAG TPA: glyceraldehyde-3-phosphate dehydrogenase [Flavobacteriales bacterium]|nr:glyceraldehyde-3-phosphate dehydrogenase [Flavobacteriales bacterium]HIA12631.1 glyceraldehyde-3-phosphate dehydrogenase [Flavobacteriales bacterium]
MKNQDNPDSKKVGLGQEAQHSNGYESQLSEWVNREKASVLLANLVGQLWYDKSIEVIIFRRPLVDRRASQILNFHEYARNVVGKPITIHDSLFLASELTKLALPPSWIDIGRLSAEWITEKEDYENNATNFLKDKLKDLLAVDHDYLKPKDVALFGFGRVGRLVAREIIAQAGKGQQLRLRAIITRSNTDKDIIKRAELLRVDSVHGFFPGTVIEDLENKALIVNGHTIKMLVAEKPGQIDLEAHGIKDALLIDNTGIVRKRDELSWHLNAKGISKVLLTAPGKDDVPNIVHGVNHEDFDRDKENIYSAASCTTNAIVPVLHVVENTLGIESGHIESIHAYTNDQNLLDNFHKKYRRGRSAALNMVITETGAAKACIKAIPSLKGKLTANAVRVPTPNGSLAILSLRVKKETSKEVINDIIKHAALNGDLVEQIQYSYSNETVSSDIVGNSCASIFDSPSTIVSSNGRDIILYVWYDNEYGYSCQVVRLAKHISDVVRLKYY